MTLTVWPLAVRLFHWTNAALFLATYGLLEGGEDWHAYAGYGVAALVSWRIAHGLLGRGPAGFRAFWPTPSRLRRYIAVFPDRDGEFPGHNPAGALMILFLLAGLLLTALTGWLQETHRFWGEEWVQRLHEIAADALMAAVALHVAAVLLMQRLSGKPLLRAMFRG